MLAIDKTQAQKSRDGTYGKSQNPDSFFFEVEISNPYYSGPSNITIYDYSRGGPGEINKNQNSINKNDIDDNKMVLHFSPKSPATYPCLLILKSLYRTDIRVIKIIMTAIPQMIKAQIEFVVPARGAVTQEILIVNNSERDWLVKYNLTKSSKDKMKLLVSMLKKCSSNVKQPTIFCLPSNLIGLTKLMRNWF